LTGVELRIAHLAMKPFGNTVLVNTTEALKEVARSFCSIDNSFADFLYDMDDNDDVDIYAEVELGEESKASIERGLEDIQHGRIHSDENVRSSIRERILKTKKE
jgi:hypothetical protein